MGVFHKDFTGDDLHISKTQVSTGDPNGVVTAGVIGEFYWDETNGVLYIAEAADDSSWVSGSAAFDSFLELVDTPSTYSGQAGLSLQVNSGETAIEFGQALDTTDSPSFGTLTLTGASSSTTLSLDSTAGALRMPRMTETQRDALTPLSGFQIFNTTSLQAENYNGTSWIAMVSTGANIIGTPVDNQLAIWTSDTGIEGDSELTFDGAQLLTANGTELLPSFSFVSDPDTGMRRVSSDVLGFSALGLDVLQLTAETDASLHLLITALEDGDEAESLVVFSLGGTATGDAVLKIDGGDGGLRLGTETNNIQIGNHINSVNPVIQVTSAGAVAFGITDAPVSSNGLVLQSQASSTSHTQTKTRMTSPATTGRFEMTVHDLITTGTTTLGVTGPSTFTRPSGSFVDDGFTVGELITSIGFDLGANNGTFTIASVAALALGIEETTLTSELDDPGTEIFEITSADVEFDTDFEEFIFNTLSGEALRLTGLDVVIGGTLNTNTIPSGTDTFAMLGANQTFTGNLVFESSPTFSDGLTMDGGTLLQTSTTDPTLTGVLIDNTNLDAVRAVYVSGKFAYAASFAGDSLSVIDITVPAAPTLTGVLIDNTNLNGASGVYVAGKYAYVVSFTADSLSIVDISDPTAPILTGVLTDSVELNGVSCIYVSGQYAYVSSFNREAFAVVDISDPTAPTLAASLVDNTNFIGIEDVYVVGQYAYVVSSTSDSLSIVDISDPTAPTLTGALIDNTDLNGANNIYVSGKYAYIACFNRDSLTIVDISDPTSPAITGLLVDNTNLDSARGVYVSGKYAYVASLGANSLAVIDVSDPTTPVMTGLLTDNTNLDGARFVHISGKYAYVVSQNSDSFSVIDISGIDIPTASIGNVETGSLQVVENAIIGNDLYSRALYVENNALIGGELSIITDTDDVVEILKIGTTGTNGGITNKFVGGRDPAGNITGKGGDEYYRNDTELSGSYESLESTTGTAWFRRSINPASSGNTIREIHSEAQFEEAAVSFVIAVSQNEDLTYHFKTSVLSGTLTVFTCDGDNANLRFEDFGFDNFIISVNPGTFITGDDAGILEITRLGIASFNGGTLFDWTGVSEALTLSKIDMNGGSVISGWNMGSVSRHPTSEFGPLFNADTVGWINRSAGLIVDSLTGCNINKCLFAERIVGTSNDSVVSVFNSSGKASQFSMRDNFGELLSGETLVRIDAGIPDTHSIAISGNTIDFVGTATLFDTTGSTGAFTVVADNSIAATAITSVTDNSGVAVFNHAGTSPDLGSKVTISGFTTNTVYNTTGIVTLTTATTFEIDYVVFGSDETGSFLVDGVTVTATAHGLTQGTGVTLDCDFATDYDGGSLIYNIQTNSFDIPAVFTATAAGTWSTEGLDQTDPRVLAFTNPGTADSAVIAFGFTNANATATTITDGTYAAIDATTFEENEVTQRFKLIDNTTALFELTALEDFSGFLTGSLTAVKTGVTADYRFAMSTNGAIPTFATAKYIPMEVKTTKVNIALGFSVNLSKGETIQIMAAGDGTADNLTITDLQFGIQ